MKVVLILSAAICALLTSCSIPRAIAVDQVELQHLAAK